MNFEKYTVDRDNIKNILGYIESGEIAIPELQRPFVWHPIQITELIESLYNGLPTGFIVMWTNDKMRLKDGTVSLGKKIIIDGQQRITALRSALLGQEVVTEDFSTKIFKVAYNPFNEKFETQKPTHFKSSKWITDISIFFKNDFSDLRFIKEYTNLNPEITDEELQNRIQKVKNIVNREIGRINLSPSLTLNEATNIFNLMNSKGTRLGQEDFVMAKLSADEKHEGYYLWKTIDYFCKGLHNKTYIDEIPSKDSDFANTEYYDAIKWISKINNNIYIPTYNDILRVSYSHIFKDGILRRLSDLLSGRNFKTKSVDEEVIDNTFKMLKEGLFNFVNEHNFKQFSLFIESTGVKYKKLINSQSALNSAYVMYLLLKDCDNIKKVEIKNYVQKWYIMSVLTGRYSASSESKLDQDLKRILERGFKDYFYEVEKSELNNEFWNTVLIQKLESSGSTSPAFLVYLAAQIYNQAFSLFSSNVLVESLIKIKGDNHHIFPVNHLIENNIKNKEKINQVANYACIDTSLNVDISDEAPNKYFNNVLLKCTANNTLGFVKSKEAFYDNLKQNCIPKEVLKYNYKSYEQFLKKRRILMSKYIEEYYKSL